MTQGLLHSDCPKLVFEVFYCLERFTRRSSRLRFWAGAGVAAFSPYRTVRRLGFPLAILVWSRGPSSEGLFVGCEVGSAEQLCKHLH